MRRTRLGVLVLAVGFACFALAFAVRSIAPALLGMLLVAAARAQRPPSGLVEVHRLVPGEVREDEPFEAVIEASAAGTVPVFLEADVPATLQLLEMRSEPARGKARLTFRAVARQPGAIVWGHVRVRVQDAWGLVEQEITVPLSDVMRVAPGMRGVAAGRAAARADTIGARSKRANSADWDPEIERLREYVPGDRVRDIDWAHSTTLGELITRERSRQAPLPLVVLMQATSEVRRMRRVSKFETFRLTALGVLAAAQSAGLSAGLVAYDDRGIAAQVRVTGGRKAIAATVQRIAQMPAVELVPTIEASLVAASDENVMPTPEERDFLAAIARFDTRAMRGLTPIEAALAAVTRVSPQPAIVVCLLDVEEAPALAKTVVQRLARHGHKCIVAAPASGMHHYARSEVDDNVLDSLVTWRRNREEAARACRELHVPFVVLGDRVDSSAIGEVIRSSR